MKKNRVIYYKDELSDEFSSAQIKSISIDENYIYDRKTKGKILVSAKTVVGDAVTVNDTIILPLVDVSFGVGAGAFAGEKKNNAGGAMTGKMSPSAVLVIQNGATKLVNIKNQDTVTKILDMVPDIIDKFTGKSGNVTTDDDINDAIDGVAKEFE